MEAGARDTARDMARGAVSGGQAGLAAGIWRDPSRSAAERVADLLGRMTLAEKLAQLASIWLGAAEDGDGVAPMQGEFSADLPPEAELIRSGMGQLTRVFGTRPVTPDAGARALAGLQEHIVAASRFGIRRWPTRSA